MPKRKTQKRAKSKSAKKSTRTAKSRKPISKAQKFSPVPPDFRTITPYLTIKDALAALDFYKKAFGASELQREVTPEGRLIHGRLKIGDSIIMVSEEFLGGGTSAPITAGTTTVTLHIYTDDVDGFWEKALAAGARIAMPLDNQFWGERYGQLVDPFGHRWSVSMQIKMDPEEMELKRKAAMQMFSEGTHPVRENDQPSEESVEAAGVG
jgi:PhnB protein